MLEIDGQILRAAADSWTATLDRARQSYYQTKITESASDRRALFRIVAQLTSRQQTLILPSHDDLELLLNSFGVHFGEKVATIRKEVEEIPTLYEFTDRPLEEAVESPAVLRAFLPMKQSAVSEIISAIPCKSCPLDPIPTSLLKRVSDVLVPSITSLVNLSLLSGEFPSNLKSAIVTPLLKKPTLCPEIKSNYRAISSVATSSKILERSAASQLNDHLSTNKLYVPVQSAYRQKHSTETALLRVVNDLLLSIDSGKASMLVLLDLSAAFDTVDHDILVNRLRDSFCIQDKALSWFQSYLSDRTQTVRVFDVSSKKFPLLFGVPQGTVLGHPLYTCYSSPTYEIAKRRGIISHSCADDYQFQQDFVMDDDHVGQLGAYDRMYRYTVVLLYLLMYCIGETADWMAQNRCKLNDPKTDFMLVYSDRRARKPAPLKLRVGDCELEPVQKVKNLGVILDSHLSMEAQVNSICRRAYFHLRSIGLIRKHLDLQTTKILVHAFVASTLDYCNSLLNGLPAKLLKKLQLVQNASARLIFRLRKNTLPHIQKNCTGSQFSSELN